MRHVSGRFEIARACDDLETLARQQDRSSPVVGALEIGALALHYIYGAQGGAFSAYIAGWVDEAMANATDGQRSFLQRAKLVDDQDDGARYACGVRDDDDGWEPANGLEGRPSAETLPNPENAVALLESLASTLDPCSVGRTCVELSIGALRFISDSGNATAFSGFVGEFRRDELGSNLSPPATTVPR